MTSHTQTPSIEPRRWWQLSILQLVSIGLPLIIFVTLAALITSKSQVPGDTAILRHIHMLLSPTLTTISKFLTDLGSAPVVIIAVAFAVVWLWLQNQRQHAVFLFLAAAGTSAINVIAKLIFTRPRPELWHHLVTETDYSFPSGHAMITSAMALAVVLLLWRTKYKWPAIIVGGLYVFLVGFSRLYLGVHYPSDILGGWCVSIVWITVLHHVVTSYRRTHRTPA